jgi:predicted CopG family antitoxin
MANEQNLKPITSLSKEEAKRRGSIGGKASVEARREKKLFKEEILKRMGEKDWNDIVDKLIERAKKNDKSFEVLRDTIGQKPKEEVEHEVKMPVFNIEVTDNKELEKKFLEDETDT